MRKSRLAARSRGRQPSPSLHIDSLPGETLGRALTLLDKKDLAAAASVCRSWRAVAFREPRLWRRLILHTSPNRSSGPRARAPHEADGDTWRPGKLRLAQRVGGYVRSLAIMDGSLPTTSWPLDDVFAAVPPSQLELLSYEAAEISRRIGLRMEAVRTEHQAAMAALSAALQQAPQLFVLRLACNRLPAAAAAAVLQMPMLVALHLDCSIPADFADSLSQRLRNLASLSLAASSLPDMRSLAGQLPQLRHLALHDSSNEGEGTLWLPPPASFPLLRAFDFSSRRRRWQVAGSQALLQRAVYATTADEYSRCTLGRGGKVWEADAPPARLYLLGASHPEGLAPLLSALVPPGLPLQGLTLRKCQLDAEQLGLAPLRALAHFHYLDIGSLVSPPGAAAAGLQLIDAAAQQAQQLTHLSLSCADRYGGELPPALVQRRGLKRLELAGLGLRDLPVGPYLEELEELHLPNNAFHSLPPVLAAATGLRRLELGVVMLFAPVGDLALTERDVRRVLAPLTRLTFVCLAQQPRPGERALQALRSLLPGCSTRVMAPAGEGGKVAMGPHGMPRHEFVGGEKDGSPAPFPDFFG